MSNYYPLTLEKVVNHAQRYVDVVDPEQLSHAQEVSDGNVNVVYKILDKQCVSQLVVKQALPYVRCAGEGWPLTVDRTRLEAQILLEHYKYCPEHTVKIYHYHAELAAIVMEDLSNYQLWRSILIQGIDFSQAAIQLGEYFAQVLFHTSDFYLTPNDKKSAIVDFMNPAMCEISESLFFDDPYQGHIRNHYPQELAQLVEKIQSDNVLKVSVARLKHHFFCHTEALLHGDIHSGSIFVTENKLKVIDAEFGFFGPMGFDIGSILGNLLLNYCGLPGLLPIEEVNVARAQRERDIQQLWQTFAQRFITLAAQHTKDLALAQPGYAQKFLQKVWQDTLGFAGTELIRRTIGFAHVADLENIADHQQALQAKINSLGLGRALIIQADKIQGLDNLFKVIHSFA